MAIAAPTGNTSSIETQTLQAQRQAELNIEPTLWEPVIFNGEGEGEGELAFESPEGRRLECRVEAQGTIVRLRGAIKVKTGKEVKAAAKFGNMPTSAEGSPPNTRPAHTKEVTVASSTTGTAILTIESHATGNISLSAAQVAGALVSFDGVTYDLS